MRGSGTLFATSRDVRIAVRIGSRARVRECTGASGLRAASLEPEVEAEARRLGAADFLRKPVLDVERLAAALRRAAVGPAVAADVPSLPPFHGLIAASRAMRDILSWIESVAPRAVTVLLTGETGTGKEAIARAIHAASGRRGHFVCEESLPFYRHLIERTSEHAGAKVLVVSPEPVEIAKQYIQLKSLHVSGSIGLPTQAANRIGGTPTMWLLIASTSLSACGPDNCRNGNSSKFSRWWTGRPLRGISLIRTVHMLSTITDGRQATRARSIGTQKERDHATKRRANQAGALGVRHSGGLSRR